MRSEFLFQERGGIPSAFLFSERRGETLEEMGRVRRMMGWPTGLAVGELLDDNLVFEGREIVDQCLE